MFTHQSHCRLKVQTCLFISFFLFQPSSSQPVFILSLSLFFVYFSFFLLPFAESYLSHSSLFIFSSPSILFPVIFIFVILFPVLMFSLCLIFLVPVFIVRVCFRMFTAESVRSVLLKMVECGVGCENRSKELVLLTLCLPITAHCLPPFSWLHTRLFFSCHLNKMLQ